MLNTLFIINTTLIALLLGFLFTQKRVLERRTFGLFLLYLVSIFTYSLSILWQLQMPAETLYTFGSFTYFTLQVSYFTAVSYLFSEFLFARTYLKKTALTLFDKTLIGIYALVCIMIFVPGSVFDSVKFTVLGNAIVERTMGDIPFSLFALFCMLASVFTFFYRYKKAQSLIVKNQFWCLFWASGLTNFLGVTANLILPTYFDVIYFDAIGPLFFIFAIGFFIYATTTYRFLDIRMTLQKYLIFVTNGLLYVLPIIGVLNGFSQKQISLQAAGIIVTGVAILLVLCWGQTLPVFAQFWNYLFYAKKTNPLQDIAGSLESFKASTTEGMKNLSLALGVNNARFAFINEPDGKGAEALKKFLKEHPNQALVKQELAFKAAQNDSVSAKLKAELQELTAAAVVPVKNAQQQLLGFLVLEQKIDGSLFSIQELEATKQLLKEANIYISRERDYSKSLERLEQQGHMDKDFLDGLMHEIRHPLMMARNVSEIIDWAQLCPADQEFLKESETSLQGLSKKLERISEAASWAQGNMSVQKTIGSLVQLRQFIREDMQKENPDWLKLVDFKWESSDLEKDLFYFDMGQLKRVFVELGKNATFFKGPGKLKMTMRAFQEGEDIVVHYTDNGIGIAKEYWDKIFDLMFVIASSRNEKEAGLGLGLTIVRGILQAHGGDVKVLRSELGKGTTFEIRAPLERYKGR